MGVSIFPAGPAQFDEILSFWKGATEVPSSTDDLDGLATLWAHDPEALLVATDVHHMVGTLVVAWDGWRGTFYRLAVRPDQRRRGVGRALVAEGERRLKARGARRISLYAVEAHATAVGFWTGLGYLPDRAELRFVRNVQPTDGPTHPR